MKIRRIQGILAGFDTAPPLGNARTVIRRRDFLLIAVETECGKRGWGEVFNAPFAASEFIRRKVAPALLGRTVLDRLPIYDTVGSMLAYDRRGASRMAQSAIDMAVHDAAGQVLGCPVAELLGGRLRSEVFAYASGPFMAEDGGYDHYGEETDALLAQGFRALKPRAGQSPRADGRMVADMRARIGDDIGLMVDINQGYTRAAALESVKRMEDAGLLWIEEPLQPEDLPGYRLLAASSRVAIAGGEALGSLAAFRDALDTAAFSVLQPDPTVCGGFTGFQQIAALGAAHDVPVIPHSFGTIVGAMASLHLAALQPSRRIGSPADYPFLEIDVTANPLFALRALPLEANGTVRVPDEPGLGLHLSPEELEPYAMDHWCV